jgi:hypothetical protein
MRRLRKGLRKRLHGRLRKLLHGRLRARDTSDRYEQKEQQ